MKISNRQRNSSWTKKEKSKNRKQKERTWILILCVFPLTTFLRIFLFYLELTTLNSILTRTSRRIKKEMLLKTLLQENKNTKLSSRTSVLEGWTQTEYLLQNLLNEVSMMKIYELFRLINETQLNKQNMQLNKWL